MGGYQYLKERPRLFTDEGQRMFLQVRDHVKRLLREAGSFRMDCALTDLCGSSWEMLACVDRLVELKEIVECTHPNTQAAQNRIFSDGGWAR